MTTEAPQAQQQQHMPLPSGVPAAQPQAGGAQGLVAASPGGAAAAPAQPDSAAAGGNAGAASPPTSPQDEESRRKEDELLKRGMEIASVRALLARAYSRPAEEPALPLRHWDHLLLEMRWLAVDMTQERLWKQTAAMAVALEVARMQGVFGLKQPPKDCRQYSEEVRRLREAAAKEAKAAAGKRPSPAASRAAAENGSSLLKLDPADDPIFADLDLLDLTPGTPPTNELYLSYQHDEAFSESLHELLAETEVERLIKEEIAMREYVHEFDAALVSHHLAVQEENRRALALDAGLAAEGGLDLLDGEGAGLGAGGAGEEEEDGAYLVKKAAKRRKQGGYLLDDFKDLDTESMGGSQLAGSKRQASRAQIEETYFRKKRRERYRDVDVDYDISQEQPGRYATRRQAANINARASTRIQDQQKKKSHGIPRADSFGGQQMLRHRGAAGVTGMVLWNKAEDDLLLAIAHEFSGNWTLVSEVLSLSLSMQGIYRPPAMCKQRFRQITTSETGEYNEELALINLSQTLTKQQAREMLMASLPVRDDVLMPLMEALVQIGAAAKQRRQAEEKKNDPVRSRRQDSHQSHAAVHAVVMQQTGNRTMNPLELGEAVNAAFSQQAKQQQLLAVQAMQAQSQAAAAAAAAAAGVPKALPAAQQPQQQQPPQQPMQTGAGGAAAAQGVQPAQQQQQQGVATQQQGAPAMGAGTPGALPMGQAGLHGGMAPQLGAAGGQLHPGQLPPGMAAPGGAGARPLLPQQAVTPQAMAQAAAAMAQQQQQQAAAAAAAAAAGGAAGTPTMGAPGMSLPQQQQAPGQAPGLVAPGLQGTPQQQQQQMLARHAAAANAAQQAAKNQITLQQLNHILATNMLPNGTTLPPEMRKQIEEKRNSYLAKTQPQQLSVQARQAQQAQQVTAAQIALQHQHQQQQAAAAAAAAGAAGAGGQPGMPQQPQQPGGLPAATAAAAALMMQQQQQAGAAGQAPNAGVRPPGLPPGLYAMQGLQPGASLALASGAGGQPMALPPGVMPSVSHQMSLAAAQAAQGGVPNLQPAMALQSAQLAAAAGHMQQQPGAAGALPASLPPGMQAAAGMALPTGLTPQQQQQQQQLLAQQLALHHHQQQQQQAAAAVAAAQAAANQAAAAQQQQPPPQQTVPQQQQQ